MATRRHVTKKLINSPESCVDDSLRGLVALYPKLQLHPKHRVITTTRNVDSGRVAILGGGGSGHEPFAAGLIGDGMLDGAVAGGVFASPPTGHVLYAITQLYKYNSGGVLVVLGNYTGDRLNFGKAIEKAKNNGIKVESFIVGEDVASSHNKTGGRSMCGEILIYKVCAALSAAGHDLASIRRTAAEAHARMATLGVCLSACSLPGQPPLFESAEDEFELGVGVHGEAGIEKMKMTTSREIVTLILDKIISHLKLASGDRVVVAINNLGGTSLMEMNIIAADTKEYLVKQKFQVERMYSGSLKTSLEMHGFQICLFHLTREAGDAWLKLLDAPTEVVGWTGGAASMGQSGISQDEDALPKTETKQVNSGPTLSNKEVKIIQKSLSDAAQIIIKNEELLNRLDSGCGDGDCGNTLKKFAQAVLSYLTTASLEYPANFLWELSDIAETDMGGSSGGIYSLGLSAASQAIGSCTSNDRLAWLSAWEGAMAAISKYGGAEPGDRTMLDTLQAGVVAFKRHLNSDLKTLAKATCAAAEEGASSTAAMTARAGRASYVASRYTTAEDAGARAVALWLTAILTCVADQY